MQTRPIHSINQRGELRRRYQGKVSRIYFRVDAAFAMPEVYEYLEAERIKYATRLPANQGLQNRIGYLLKRSGRAAAKRSPARSTTGLSTAPSHRRYGHCPDAARSVTIKARMGATHFLMKTLPRVATEMAMHVLAYNLTRVINILGVRPLMAVMTA
jgi:hypothetical protein